MIICLFDLSLNLKYIYSSNKMPDFAKFDLEVSNQIGNASKYALFT